MYKILQYVDKKFGVEVFSVRIKLIAYFCRFDNLIELYLIF